MHLYSCTCATVKFVPHEFPLKGVTMSALLMSFRRCVRFSLLDVTKRTWSSTTFSLPHERLLLYLAKRFYKVEMLLNWGFQWKRRSIEKMNAYHGYVAAVHGPHVAAAVFILQMKGGFRYAGQSEWFYADQKGKFNLDLNHRDTPLEEVNMSHTLINYTGLMNFEGQQSLRTLSLRGCPEVDDWLLARLHMFQESLKELDISHCPRITTGGLAALRHLKGLQRLDVSSLSGVRSPELVIILLQEMLPQCQITANGYDFSLKQERREEDEEQIQGRG